MADHTGRRADIMVWKCPKCGLAGWVDLSIADPFMHGNIQHNHMAIHCLGDGKYILEGFENGLDQISEIHASDQIGMERRRRFFGMTND